MRIKMYISAAAAYRSISAAVPLTAYLLSMGQIGRQTGGLDDTCVAGVVVRHGTVSLGQWVIWVIFHARVTGSSFWPDVRPEFFRFPKKMPEMQNVHSKCWNDKSHCQVSVVGLKSLFEHVMNFYFYLCLLKILWPENRPTSSHISRHLEFIIEQGHRVNWVSGSLDSRVTG